MKKGLQVAKYCKGILTEKVTTAEVAERAEQAEYHTTTAEK